jgi:hypothetical protein
MTDSVYASKFVAQLWSATKPLNECHQIFDSDIVEKINETLKFTVGGSWRYASGLLIKDEHKPAVMDIAKEMIKTRVRTQDMADMNEATLTYWMRKMDRAVRWDLQT